MHKEIIADLRMSVKDYLSANRKQQPLSELERKSIKSARLKQRLWTQEQIDYIIASSNKMLADR